MSKLRKSLDKASFRYEDVDVCLNGEASVERDRLYRELGDAADGPRTTMGPIAAVAEVQAKIDALESEMRDDLVTLRFRALSFDRWNGIIALRPPLEGVAVDARKGYNTVAVTKAAAEAGGWLVDGDTTESIPADEWADLWENLSGGDFDRIWGAVTRLNETDGWAGVGFLKKDSTKTPDSTGMSDLPATSE
ncbi:hypothetical protein AB4Z38_07110 [Arthrobacter sp. 2RAF6]|uniref:hypothetical protein n=1 Tax=Arthrobacter sp. 2RAF6 TaxID=3233002 RepID=UPI003F919ABA